MAEEIGPRERRCKHLADAGIVVELFRRSPVIDSERLRRELDEIIDPDLELDPRVAQ